MRTEPEAWRSACLRGWIGVVATHMARPHCPRRISTLPGVVYFKPAGVPLRNLGERVLTLDQFEALRLADERGMSHLEAAQVMGISRQTFGRVLAQARKTIATCLAGGLAIRIEGGAVELKFATTKVQDALEPTATV